MSLYLNHLASPKYLQAVSKVYKHFTVEEFPFIVAKQENPAWSPEVLRQRVHDLGTWEYYFPFHTASPPRLTALLTKRLSFSTAIAHA